MNNPEGLKAAHAQPGGTWGVNPNNPNQVIANKDGDIKKSGVDAAITKGATEGAGVPKIETSKEATEAQKKAALAKLNAQPAAKVEQQKVNTERVEAGKEIVQPIPDKKKAPLANMEDPPRQMGPNSNLDSSVFGVGPNQNSGYSGALEKTAMGKLGQTVDGNKITSVGVGHQNVGTSRAEQEMVDRTKQKIQTGDETPTVLGGKMNDKGTYSDQESDGESQPKKQKQRRDMLAFQIEAREVLDRVLKREAFKRSVAQKLARRDFLESMVPMVEVY